MVVIGLFVVITGVVVRAAHPLMWFVEASVIAALSWAAVQRVARHVPAWVAVLILTGAAAAAVSAVGTAGFTELQNESVRFRDSVPAAARKLEGERPLGGVLSDIRLGDQVARIADQVAGRFELGSDLPGLASRVGGGVSAVFVVWVLSVMLVFTGPGMAAGALGAMPEGIRSPLSSAVRRAYGMVLRYLGLTAVRSVAVGLLVYLVAVGLGIDMPAMLALVAGLAAAVPYVGIGLGALPLALLAILRGPGEALTIVGVAVAVQLVDSLLVQPRIDRASFSFGMFPTLVVAMVGISLYGVIGLFVGLVIGAMALAVLHTLDDDDQARRDPNSRAATPSSIDGGDAPEATASSTDSSSAATSDT